MNILYLGHYRENTDLGNSCKRFIKGLTQKHENVAIRPIYSFHKNIDRNLSELYEQSETKHFNSYDCVIQHTTPNLLSYNKNYKYNIGVVDIYTQNINQSCIGNYLNLMDEIYVRSNYAKNALNNIIRSNKIKVIPEPFEAIDIEDKEKIEDFIFIAKGDLKNRYNLKKIITAFLWEYMYDSKIKLVIYIQDNPEKISNMIKNIYKRLRFIADDDKIILLRNDKNDINENNLIHLADCAINIDTADPSGIFTIKNLLCNNLVITQDKSASCDFINDKNGVVLKSFESNIEYYEETYDESVYSIHETCYDVNMNELRRGMREITNLSLAEIDLKKSYINKNYFSYESFGELIV